MITPNDLSKIIKKWFLKQNNPFFYREMIVKANKNERTECESMDREKRRFCFGIAVVCFIVAVCASPQFRHIYALPAQMSIVEGEKSLFEVEYPLTFTVSNLGSNIEFEKSGGGDVNSKPVFWETVKNGQTTIDYKLLGIIPLKQVQVDVMPKIKLMPGGQSIGVVLRSEGILIVGSSAVNFEGKSVNPAEEAGIRTGDVILSINGQSMKRDIEVAEIIDKCGRENKEMTLLLRRNTEEITAKLRPVLCSETNRYRIGLFVRDSAAGVGTLTFIDSESLKYGALGHVIADADTNQDIVCREGKIVPASVSEIHFGKVGRPGEKVGSFLEEKEDLGTIEKNTPFGIFGKIHDTLKNYVAGKSLEVASMNEIKEGEAQMLTVVDGQTVDKFLISIEKVHMQGSPEGKGLVLKVTDERLLAKTGGIIQGMSGSPIIQNGKLVGVVTHVFVHDPTKGYGCFMDWMLMECGLIPKKAPAAIPGLFG